MKRTSVSGSTETAQKKFWSGPFAKGYVNRNFCSVRQLDAASKKLLGTTRTRMNKEFLRSIPKDARILEVGTNVGNQLLHLRTLGFTDLYGIEFNPSIAAAVRERLPWANVIAGDALDIPFKDAFFDCVFTTHVLIHIAPKNIRRALGEICRVSNGYVWGFEYFDEKYTEISYRGHSNVLWKTDFPALYKKVCPELRLIKQRFYPNTKDPSQRDVMFLFRKNRAR